MRPLHFISISALVLLVFSCKKETKEDVTPVVQTIPIDYEMMRITKPEWLIYKVELGGTDIWKIPGMIETCSKDDTYRFYRDSTLTSFENADICAGNTDSTQSHWEFLDGRKKLTATLLGNSDTATIMSLTDSTMQLFFIYSGMDANVFFRKK